MKSTGLIEPLLERAEEFGKTSYELIKLRTLDKIANVMSVFISKSISIIMLNMVLALLNIGVALWLGEVLGKLYYGFFCVAGFYVIILCIFHFFLNNRVKKSIGDSLIFYSLN